MDKADEILKDKLLIAIMMDRWDLTIKLFLEGNYYTSFYQADPFQIAIQLGRQKAFRSLLRTDPGGVEARKHRVDSIIKILPGLHHNMEAGIAKRCYEECKNSLQEIYKRLLNSLNKEELNGQIKNDNILEKLTNLVNSHEKAKNYCLGVIDELINNLANEPPVKNCGKPDKQASFVGLAPPAFPLDFAII